MKRFAIVLLLASLGVTGLASAAPTPAEKQKAAHSFQVGTAAYAKGDFAGAAAAFEQAALYAPHPSTLLNAAESWELAENPARAAQLCDRVLESPNLESQHRQAAQKQLARLEKKVGTIVVKAASDARIELDDKEEKSAGTHFRVSSGPHKVKVTAAGGEARTQSVTVAGGETKELDFLTPPPPKPPAEVELKPSPLAVQNKEELAAHEGGGPPVATWLCFGAGAVGTGFAVYFGVKTLDAKDNFDAHPTATARDEFNSARLATDVAIGVAAVGFAVGIVLWATAPSSGKSVASFDPRVRW
jgi:hypothetical protein